MSDTERVSAALDNWLRTEVVESSHGRNQYLDDFDRTRHGLALPTYQPDALDALKSGAHFVRYKRLLEVIDTETLLGSDIAVGKLIHHSLMFTSGGFRLESFLRATNQGEYQKYRFAKLSEPNGATSVPIIDVVESALAESSKRNIHSYLGMNREINDSIIRAHEVIPNWFTENPSRTFAALSSDELPIEAAKSAQYFGLTLAASHIFVVASLRGVDVGDIPVFEPKSITDAELTNLRSIPVPAA